LQCAVCGFMCHVECQYQATPCISQSNISEMRALLSKKRIYVSKKADSPVSFYFADYSQAKVKPELSAFSTSKRLLKPPSQEKSSKANLMTVIQVQKRLQEVSDKFSKFLPQVMLIQRSFRYKQFKEMKEMAAKRMQVVEEIVSCERSYVEQLNSIINNFQIPLSRKQMKNSESESVNAAGQMVRSSGSIKQRQFSIPQRLLKTIFGNIKLLCSAITHTLSELEKSAKENPLNTVTMPLFGSVFIAEINNIAEHVDYVINFNDALDALAQAQRNPQFAKEFRELLRANKVLDFTDLLVVPVQHTPRYIILIERLLGRTHVLHPDHAPLVQALDLVKRLAAYMNERRKMKESMQALQNDFAGMQDVLNDPTRYLVMKGPLVHYSSSRKGTFGFDYCFLFNDLLIATKQMVSEEETSHKSEDFEARHAVVLRIRLNERAVLLPTVSVDGKESSKLFLFELEHEPDVGTGILSLVPSFHSKDHPLETTKTIFSAPDEKSLEQWISNLREILQYIAEEHKPPHIKTFQETLQASA